MIISFIYVLGLNLILAHNYKENNENDHESGYDFLIPLKRHFDYKPKILLNQEAIEKTQKGYIFFYKNYY